MPGHLPPLFSLFLLYLYLTFLLSAGWLEGGRRSEAAGKEAASCVACRQGERESADEKKRMSASLLRHQVALPRLQLAASTPAMKLPGRDGAHSPRCCTREADARISTEDGDEEDVVLSRRARPPLLPALASRAAPLAARRVVAESGGVAASGLAADGKRPSPSPPSPERQWRRRRIVNTLAPPRAPPDRKARAAWR